MAIESQNCCLGNILFNVYNITREWCSEIRALNKHFSLVVRNRHRRTIKNTTTECEFRYEYLRVQNESEHLKKSTRWWYQDTKLDREKEIQSSVINKCFHFTLLKMYFDRINFKIINDLHQNIDNLQVMNYRSEFTIHQNIHHSFKMILKNLKTENWNDLSTEYTLMTNHITHK